MNDLFRSELRRFGRYALIAAVVHLLLLSFMARTTNLLQQSYFESAPLFGLYLLLGLALAFVQVGSYRKPSQWLWLIHRPLPARRIFAALALSALVLLATTIMLPQLLLIIGMDLFTAHVVDSRHYLMLLHVLAFALMAWMAGCHAVLSRHKLAIAVLAMPLLFALHLVSVWWLLLPVLACMAWLTFVAMHSVRADRDAPLRSNAALLLTALPLQLGCFLLAFEVGQMVYVTGGILLGTDPLNTEYPPQGGLIETQRKVPGEVLILGLEGSADPRAASWREQLPLLEPIRIDAFLQRYPTRHQLSNLQMPTEWFDEERGILWTFSHDHMLFQGRDPRSGAEQGWWGVNGAGDTQPFGEVPIADGHGYLLTRQALYAIDAEQQRQHELIRLPEGEWFIEIPRAALDRLWVLTNRRLLAYRADRQAVSKFAPPQLDWALSLPRGPAHLEGAEIVELMDGWLVSIVYGDGHRQIGFSQFNTVAQPWQQVVFVDDTGAASVVGERQIRRDYPALYQLSWWLSPPLHALSEWPESALDKGLTWPLQPEFLPKAGAFYGLAGVLMLVSFGLGLWWLRGSRLPIARRRVWLTSCALIGLPAFLSLVCLEPRAAQH